MKRSTALIAGFLLAGTLPACGEASDAPPDARDAQGIAVGPSDGTLFGEHSAEGKAIFELVNRDLPDTRAVDQFRQLLETEIHEAPVDGIIGFRLGQDDTVATEDDQTFNSLRTLDRVEFVGPVAIKGLLRVAEAEGLVGTTEVCDLTNVLEAESDGSWKFERMPPLEALHEQSCSRIENAVELDVDDELPADFANLEPFNGIRAIEGELAIDSTYGLESLRGLDALEELHSLSIDRNEGDLELIDGLGGLQKLETLVLSGDNPVTKPLRIDGGLAALEEVEAHVLITDVQGVDALTSLRAIGGTLRIHSGFHDPHSDNVLPSLERVDRLDLRSTSLEFRDMPNLQHIRSLKVQGYSVKDFRGLEHFERFEDLQITGGSVESFDGLQNVTAIGRLHLDLSLTDETNDYTGLSGLELIGEDLFIYSPRKERNVGFASLTTIERNLDIDQTRITDLRGTFPALRHISGNIEISDQVDEAEVEAFVDQLDHFTGTITRRRIVNR